MVISKVEKTAVVVGGIPYHQTFTGCARKTARSNLTWSNEMTDKTTTAAEAVKTISRMAELYGYLMAGLHTLSAAFGKEPTDKNAKVANAVYGLRGLDDEREFYDLLLSFSSDSDKDDRWILLEFLKFLFPRVTVEEKLVTWYGGNRYRTFVVKMDDPKGPDKPKAKAHLKDIVERIKIHGKNKDGYAKVQDELLDQSVPIPSKDAAKSLEKARAALTNVLKQGGPAAVAAAKAVGAEAVRLAQWTQANVPPAIAQARMDAETNLINLRSQPPTSVFERILRRMY